MAYIYPRKLLMPTAEGYGAKTLKKAKEQIAVLRFLWTCILKPLSFWKTTGRDVMGSRTGYEICPQSHPCAPS